MALEEWKQKTIDEAIRDGLKKKYSSAQFHFLKYVGLDRPKHEHKLLVKLLLHVGIDKGANPEWTFTDDEVMEFVKCEKSTFLNALAACREDQLFSHTGPPAARKYTLVISNMIDTMRVEHQIEFYRILGKTKKEICLLVGSTSVPEIPSHGKSAQEMETVSITWKERPGDGSDFHHMGAPNKEEEQLEEQLQEQLKTGDIGNSDPIKPEAIPLPESLDVDAFRVAWTEWIAYRRKRRLTVLEQTMRLQLAKLEKIGPSSAAECLLLSIGNGWQGIFPEKTAGNGHAQTTDAELFKGLEDD